MKDWGRMVYLVDACYRASLYYYLGVGNYDILDIEYDQMFDELSALEDKLGVIFPDSMTQRVEPTLPWKEFA